MPIVFVQPYIAPVNWMALLGSSSTDRGASTVVDSGGNIIVGGLYYNGSNYDAVIAKYSPAGTLQWQRIFGGSGTQSPYSITVDASDNIIFSGPLFLAKYSSAGSLLWQRSLPDVSGERVLVLGTGEIIVGGYTTTVGAGSNDAILVKLSADGSTTIWSRAIGVSGAQLGTSAGVDSSGNIYIISTHGGGPFIAKYNTSGVIQWQQKLSGVSNPAFYDMTITGSDDIYVVGSAGAPTYAGAMMVKYDTSGNVVFQKRYSLSSSTRFLGVTHDSTGDVYAIGETASTGKILIGKYDSSGVRIWERSIGETNASSNNGNGIFIHTSGDVCITGELDNLGEGGSSDIFHARLPADGSKTGTYSLGGVNIDYTSVTATTATLPHTESAAGMTDQSVSITNSAGSFTDAAGSLVTDFISL